MLYNEEEGLKHAYQIVMTSCPMLDLLLLYL